MSAVETEAKAAEIVARHRSVSQALADVMAELPAIGKGGRADPKQGGYAYRGIEQITAHVQPLFAKHGVVFAPRVEHFEVREIEVNGKPWTDTIELVAYDVYGPAGDHITVGPILAIGRDNSDKGANKCMTQAFKYALLQTLCISDANDDGDQASHEASGRPQAAAPERGHGGPRVCPACDKVLTGKPARDPVTGSWVHEACASEEAS